MRLAVANGTLVTPTGSFQADVVSENGRVVGLVDGVRSTEVDDIIDARGLLVFPGFIDPHIHSRDPGLTEKEDFAHSTAAAAAGGVTTVLEMPNAVPPVTTGAVFEDRRNQHERVAMVDFGLWGMSLGSDNLDQIPDLIEAGVVGIKLFWGYALHKETLRLVYNLADEPMDALLLPPGNREVFELFARVAGSGGLLAAHCEDRGVIEAATSAFGRPAAGYEDFLVTRPDAAESTSVATACEFARATGCRFHIVHMSAARSVEILRQAQRAGISVTGETCPQYLTLTDASYESIGPIMKVFPPVRRAEDQAALWRAIDEGVITSVGSDHAPHTAEEKAREWTTQPAGTVGVETIVRVMMNQALEGNVGLERLAWILSEGTARLYDLFPKKGSLMPGSDADLVLVDPEADWVIRDEELHSKHPVSPWNGARGRGRPCRALVRGETVMLDGEPVGPPNGQLVKPVRARLGLAAARAT